MEAPLKRHGLRDHKEDGEKYITALFDGMADEYDDITDFWYAWLFSRMHYLIAQFLATLAAKDKFLDVGCGTGFQTNLVALFGHDVIGIDIAGQLIAKAIQKRPETYCSLDLFRSPFAFSQRYSNRIRQLAQRGRSTMPLGRVDYCRASATHLPLGRSTRDAVLCCGSTLNFVDDYVTAVAEMARVLRPGGILMLEVENRYNPDLLWAVLEGATRIPLGFEQDLRTAVFNLTAPRTEHVLVDYPFETQSGVINMPLRLFSRSRFERELQIAGLKVFRTHAIHNITNILPSTLLHAPNPGRTLTVAAEGLAACEAVFGRLPIIRYLGCSQLYLCVKRN